MEKLRISYHIGEHNFNLLEKVFPPSVVLGSSLEREDTEVSQIINQ